MSKKFIITGLDYKILRAVRMAKQDKETRKLKRVRQGLACVTTAALCLAMGVGCTFGEQSQSSTKKEPLTGTHVFNSFDSFSDVLWVSPNGAQYSTQYNMDICKEAEYIHDGTGGSLRYDYIGGTSPALVLRIANSALSDMDVSDLKNVSMWIFNSSENNQLVSLDVVNTSLTSLIGQEFELVSGEWTKVTLPVNAIVTKYRKDEIVGFSFKFLTTDPSTFYIDEMLVEFGKVMTEEDNLYLGKVEKIVADINALPEKITVADGAKIEEIFNEYNALPTIYKMGVSNYKELYALLEDMKQIAYNAETSLTERTAFYFDKPYGLTQIAPTYTSHNEIEYSTEVKYGDESGSLKLLFEGDQWNYFAPVAQATLSQYDYVSFYVYNEGTDPKVFWFNWNQRVNVDPGQWTYVEMPTSVFKGQGGQLIVTSVPKTDKGYGGSMAAYGALYFSRITCHSLGVETLYSPVLNNANPLNVRGANMSIDGKDCLLTATEDNVVLDLNKQVESVSVAQKVAFKLNLPFAATLALLNDSGENVGSVLAKEGWSIVSLTAEQYNSVSSISIPALVGKTITIGGFAGYKISEETQVMLIMEEDYLPSADLMTGVDVEKAIKTVDAFYGLSAYYRNKLAAEEKNVYNRIIAKQVKVKELVLSLIENTSLSDDNADARFLLRSIYEAYTESVNFPDLTKEQKVKAESLIEQTNRLPLPIYNMSNSGDRAKLSMNMTFKWTGMLSTVETEDEGMVLGLILLDATGDTNATVAYDLSGKSLMGYEFITFKVYNPRTNDIKLHLIKNQYATGSKGVVATLKAGEWTEVCISVADFAANGCLCMSNIGRNAEDAFLFANFYAFNKEYVEDIINELPEAMAVTDAHKEQIEYARYLYDNLSSGSQKKLDSEKLLACENQLTIVPLNEAIREVISITEIKDYHGDLIAFVRKSYDALLDTAKENVENFAEFEQIEAAYNAKYKLIISSSENEGALFKGKDYNFTATVRADNDDAYGAVWSVTFTSFGDANNPNGDIKYSIGDATKAKLNECSKVSFYVYNSKDSVVTLIITDGTWATTKTVKLTAKDWTRIELTIEEFSKWNSLIFSWPGLNEYKISSIFGTKTTVLADEVISMIDALPTVETLTAFDGQRLSAAKSAYDALSASGKELVTNVEKLQSLIATYENTYVVVSDMNTRDSYSLNANYTHNSQCTLSIQQDEKYGNYLNAAYKAGVEGILDSYNHLAIKYSIADLAAKLEDCDKVYFYVYNGHTADRTMLANFGGSLNAKYLTLKAGEWTKVEVSVSDFLSGSYFGIINADSASSCDYKFSMIYATKGAN